MKVLDLFSGIGGFSLGLHRAGMETVAFCEIEPYPQAVLRKNFPGVPIYDDVQTITGERLRADGIDTIDLVCGGFPCQPFSVAGKQRGKDDHRHLWPEMFRIISEVRPTWVIGENVAGFVSMALCEVSADLESIGYEVQPFIIPACAVNAPHRRDRVWIVANSGGRRCSQPSGRQDQFTGRTEAVCTGENVSDTTRQLRNGSGATWDGRAEPANGCADDADTLGQHGDDDGHGTGAVCGERSEAANVCTSQADGNTHGSGREELHAAAITDKPGLCAGELVATGPDWSVESPFCGVANGIP